MTVPRNAHLFVFKAVFLDKHTPPISKSPSFEVHIIQEGAPLFGDTLFTNPNCRYSLTMGISNADGCAFIGGRVLFP